MIAAVALALTLSSSALVALRLSAGSAGTLAVGTYVVWVAQVVGLSLALSPFDALGRTGYLVGAAVVWAAAVALQLLRPARPAHLRRAAGAILEEIRRDRLLGLLGIVVALELAYATVIALLTPPADHDSLQYHLARPALWLQQGSLGTFGHVYDFRLNAFPPNAELVYGFLLSLWGGDRIVAVVNLLAAVALTAAVGVGARRLGLGTREAAFGALLAASLPVVALQAPSTLTDLQVAALVTCAAALLLRRAGGDLALGSLSGALALGAKVTGVFALPVLAVIACLTWRPRWWRGLLAVGAASALGAYWYVWNAAREGSPLGETSPDQRASGDPRVWLAQVMRMGLNLLDLPGAVGHDVLAYTLAAAGLLLAAAVVAFRRAGRDGVAARDQFLAAGLLAAPLLALLPEPGQRFLHKTLTELGRPDVAGIDGDRVETFASSMQSGAGPVGLALLVAGALLALRAVRRGELRRLAVGLALAPLLWIVMIGVTVAYFRWNARFTLPGFALAAMTWGLAVRTRWLAVGAVVTVAVTLLLSFVHFVEKPAGIRLLEPRTERSAFTAPDHGLGPARGTAAALPGGRPAATDGDRRLPRLLPAPARPAARDRTRGAHLRALRSLPRPAGVDRVRPRRGPAHRGRVVSDPVRPHR
jgi:hypothetical protein